jgi:hypothetical protein
VAEIWARADEDLSDDAHGGLESLRLDRKNLTEMPSLGGAVHVECSCTHSLKAPGFKP